MVIRVKEKEIPSLSIRIDYNGPKTEQINLFKTVYNVKKTKNLQKDVFFAKEMAVVQSHAQKD